MCSNSNHLQHQVRWHFLRLPGNLMHFHYCQLSLNASGVFWIMLKHEKKRNHECHKLAIDIKRSLKARIEHWWIDCWHFSARSYLFLKNQRNYSSVNINMINETTLKTTLVHISNHIFCSNRWSLLLCKTEKSKRRPQ